MFRLLLRGDQYRKGIYLPHLQSFQEILCYTYQVHIDGEDKSGMWYSHQ